MTSQNRGQVTFFYLRDANGQITGVSAKSKSGAALVTLVSSATYLGEPGSGYVFREFSLRPMTRTTASIRSATPRPAASARTSR
jgi:hypothetical protein